MDTHPYGVKGHTGVDEPRVVAHTQTGQGDERQQVRDGHAHQADIDGPLEALSGQHYDGHGVGKDPEQGDQLGQHHHVDHREDGLRLLAEQLLGPRGGGGSGGGADDDDGLVLHDSPRVVTVATRGDASPTFVNVSDTRFCKTQ